jgi:hypothetical protein
VEKFLLSKYWLKCDCDGFIIFFFNSGTFVRLKILHNIFAFLNLLVSTILILGTIFLCGHGILATTDI